MNRAPCIIACTSLDDLTAALPAKALVGVVSLGEHMLCLPHGECLLVPLASGLTLDGIAGKWELYELLPHNCAVTEDFDAIGTKTHRAVRRVARASPKVRGPWSIPQFAALFPLAAHLVPLLYDEAGKLQSPRVWDGDEPHACGAVDYRPTDAQALADTPTDTAKLFADAATKVAAKEVEP
jgi:hypothetical protein